MTTEAPPTEAMGAAMLDMLAVARHACGDAPRAKRVAGAALAAEGHDPALLLAAAGGLSWMAAARIGSDDWDGDAATADFVLGEARRGLIYGLQSGTSTRAEAEVGMAVLQLAQPGSSWAHLYDLARRRLGTHGLLDGLDVVTVAAELVAFLTAPFADQDVGERLDGITTHIMGQLAELGDESHTEEETP